MVRDEEEEEEEEEDTQEEEEPPAEEEEVEEVEEVESWNKKNSQRMRNPKLNQRRNSLRKRKTPNLSIKMRLALMMDF